MKTLIFSVIIIDSVVHLRPVYSKWDKLFEDSGEWSSPPTLWSSEPSFTVRD